MTPDVPSATHFNSQPSGTGLRGTNERCGMPIGGPEAPVHCIIDSSGVTIQPHLNCAFRKAVRDRVSFRVMVRVWVRVWDSGLVKMALSAFVVKAASVCTESRDDRSMSHFCHLCCLSKMQQSSPGMH